MDGHYCAAPQDRAHEVAGSCGNRDPLNADELKIGGRRTFHFQAESGSLFDSLDGSVQRPSLGVAAWQLRYGGNVESLFIPFDHHVKLALHGILLPLILAPAALRN